jgi:hypothetical protein
MGSLDQRHPNPGGRCVEHERMERAIEHLDSEVGEMRDSVTSRIDRMQESVTQQLAHITARQDQVLLALAHRSGGNGSAGPVHVTATGTSIGNRAPGSDDDRRPPAQAPDPVPWSKVLTLLFCIAALLYGLAQMGVKP